MESEDVIGAQGSLRVSSLMIVASRPSDELVEFLGTSNLVVASQTQSPGYVAHGQHCMSCLFNNESDRLWKPCRHAFRRRIGKYWGPGIEVDKSTMNPRTSGRTA